MFVEHKEAGEVKELDEAGKLLLKAASYIETHGWEQYSYGRAGGPACLRGAVIFSTDPENVALRRQALARVDATIGDGHFGVSMGWNDQRGRTAVEVVSKLRAVAFGL